MSGEKPAGRNVAAPVFAVLGLAVAIGLALLWPTDRQGPPGRAASTVPAEVVAVTDGDLRLRVLDGPDEGRVVSAPADGRYGPGDRVRAAPYGDGAWGVGDRDRLSALWAFAAAFVLMAVVVGGRKGLRALAGLGASVAVLVVFVLPALLGGEPAAAVALVGGLAMALVSTLVIHGPGGKGAAVLVGTSSALCLCVALALVAGQAAGLVGSEYAGSPFARGDLNLAGFVAAGAVVAALGALDDAAVTQASAVYTLHDADPDAPPWLLWRRAMTVGRDHASAVVNTLALVWAGASLPALAVSASAGLPVPEVLNAEGTAGSVLALLVGSIGLLAAIPAVTLCAVLFAKAQAGGARELAHHRARRTSPSGQARGSVGEGRQCTEDGADDARRVAAPAGDGVEEANR